MSGFRAYLRSLGEQPGIQLNALKDATDGAAADNADQIPAVIARLTRGRIDKPFRVNRSNFLLKTGPRASLRTNALNEAKLQAYEALANGAPEVVVQRLTPAAAAKSYAKVTVGSGATLTATVSGGAVTGVTVGSGGTGYVTGDSLIFGGPGTGAVATITAASGVVTAVTVTSGGTGYTSAPTAVVAASPVFAVSSTAPDLTTCLLSVLHHDCFNDGVKLSLHCDAVTSGGSSVATKILSLRVLSADDVLLDEFTGSLDPSATNDFGMTNYLPDIVAQRSDSYTVACANTTVEPNATFYGRNTSSKEKWVTSAALVCFDEGGTSYASTDYDRCIAALRNTVGTPYGYLISGGSQAVGLVGKLAELGAEINIKTAIDVPGTLTAAAARTFVEGLNIDTHLVDFYWAPLEADDPLNGGKAVWGAAGANIGMRCARNARVNAQGFAPKNFPVAGKDWPLQRTGIRQLVTLEDTELSDLAKSKINPVVSETYTDGSRFVFTDSLTSVKSTVSYKKLINVSEMASTIENWVALYGNELKQLPMSVALKKMNDFLGLLLPRAQASGWLVPAANLPNNVAFQFKVQKSSVRPADQYFVDLWASYDGTARQAIIQQTIVS